MNLRASVLVMVAFCGACCAPAWAEKTDRDKPIDIQADALRYDNANQVSVFTGNVVLTKGTIQIRGQQFEVRQDADGNQFSKVSGTATAPAFFRQKRDGVDEFFEGEGELIEYDGKADTVKFSKKAQMRHIGIRVSVHTLTPPPFLTSTMDGYLHSHA